MTYDFDSASGVSRRPAFRGIAAIFEFIGDASMIFWQALLRIFAGDVSLGDSLSQMASIGVNSLPIVVITATFSGAVLALYESQLLVQWGVGSLVGGGVSLSVVRELAPALTAVVVAARAGSAITAEIGTMKVTEQIDALRAMATSPIQYLAVPRLIALVVMLPVLTMFGMVIGTFGGYIVAVRNGVTGASFLYSTQTWLHPHDVEMGLLKTAVFGIFIATVSVQQGLSAKDGAAGVGKNTMNSVVISMVLIYISNYFLASLMFGSNPSAF